MSSQRRFSRSRAEDAAANIVPEAQRAWAGADTSRLRRRLAETNGDDRRPQVSVANPLRLINLLNDIDLLAELLPGQTQVGAWLDAFLLSAGVVQVLEDALHPDPLALNRAGSRLRARPDGIRHIGAAAGAVAAVAWAVHSHRSSGSALSGCRDEAAALAVDLARLLIGGDPARARELHARALHLRAELAGLPAHVRRDPVRLPSGLRNLDQCPEDVKAMIGLVVERWPDRERPKLVTGIRTAGSYLVQIAVACLQEAGHRDVRGLTFRPRQRWLPEERGMLRWAAEAGALVLLLDDPPNTWGTVAEAAQMLRQAGLEAASIVPVVQTFPSTAPPPASLDAHPVVVLPWERCDIHRRLEPGMVKETLGAFFGTGQVKSVTRVPLDPQNGARKHVSSLYEVELARSAPRPERRLVYAQGVGLGYFGTHAEAVSQHLRQFLPTVHGVVGGLMFRDWLPEDLRLKEPDDLETAEAMIDYVLARASALRVPDDVSRRLRGRPSLWRSLGRFLAQPFGRVEMVAWPLTEAAARALLRVRSPSVVDGNMGLAKWFHGRPRAETLKKVGFAERAFSGFDTCCYDPVFDLAGAAAGSESHKLGERLRELYSLRTDKPVDPERWLLYQLVHLAELSLEPEPRDPDLGRRMSRRFQQYFGEVLLGDVRPSGSGELCAIDIDGVLETTPLGISTTSGAGAAALRALHGHGYQPVIATGRSLPEVRERCLHYRLAGGVAEYGAAIHVARGDRVRELLTDAERSALAHVRSALERSPGVLVDRGSQLVVRAYRLDSKGRRRALGIEQVQAALAGVGGQRVRAIQGQGQTDFMVEGVTKATGLAALARELGVATNGRAWLAMAVGDTGPDLPMLELAERACAPANAQPDVRVVGVEVLSRPYQAGLEQATARLLGHRPGRCPKCRLPDLPARSRLLLALLRTPPGGSLASKSIWAAGTLARLAWWLPASSAGG
jgi:hydroxymethylpyrimidine pyrophosphatase-like HAD family hydrolase